MVDTFVEEPQTSVAERRASRRFPLRLECFYRVFEDQRLVHNGTATTANISSSGLLLETSDVTEIDMRVDMSVRWPADAVFGTLEARGKIVRVTESGVAIRVMRYDFTPGPVKAAP